MDPISSLLQRRRWLTFGCAAIVGMLVLLLSLGQSVDHQLRSFRDALRSRPASGEIHIVEIDARSLHALNKWPLRRGVHASAIDRLRAAEARSIAFDVDFSAASNAAEDAKMAAALDRAGGSVILPTFRQYEGAGSSDFIESAPIELFKDKAFLAGVNVRPDPDGYVRQMPLGVETFGLPRPSLASMIAESQAEVDRAFDIDFAIDPSTLPRHSLIDLIGGRVPAEKLAGKRIIIGATAIEVGDRYSVPGYGVIPGVVIQALAAETLLGGKVPVKLGGFWAFLLQLIVTGLALRPGPRNRRLMIFGGGTAAILALPLLTEALMATSLQLAGALAAAVAAMLVGGTALVGERFQHRALHDADTGLPNAAALRSDLAGSVEVNVVVAHIERFAAIAAGLGPAATAQLVQRVADRLKFSNSLGIVYRTDEASLAWLEAPEDEESIGDRLEAVTSLMRAPIECGRLVDVSLTFGMASGSGQEAKQLVANAALAASRAARRGARWERFVDADSEETNWHLSLLGELDAAMASGQVWNAYQPKLDIGSGRIMGVEALVRWLHPERGPISPDGFIPLVEAHGRARDLTTHVLGQAIEDALRWDRAGFPLGVGVNVSATLLADHAFIERVGEMLSGSPLQTSRITIEVTESAAMDSPEKAIAALESWRALGVNISIDDYGTGQSSLGYLQKLPATELKIDKSFVQTIETDRRNAIMVRSTIALAHELGIKVVAEGIEDAGCLELLRAMGCDIAQGFHISKPLPSEALMDLLADWSRRAA